MKKKDIESILAEEYKAQMNEQGYDFVNFLSTEELAQMNPITEDLEGLDLSGYDRSHMSIDDYTELYELDSKIESLKSEIESCRRALNDPKMFYGDKKEILEDLRNAEIEINKLNSEMRQIMDKYDFGNRKVR